MILITIIMFSWFYDYHLIFLKEKILVLNLKNINHNNINNVEHYVE